MLGYLLQEGAVFTRCGVLRVFGNGQRSDDFTAQHFHWYVDEGIVCREILVYWSESCLIVHEACWQVSGIAIVLPAFMAHGFVQTVDLFETFSDGFLFFFALGDVLVGAIIAGDFSVFIPFNVDVDLHMPDTAIGIQDTVFHVA